MSGTEEIFQRVMDQGHSAAWDQKWDQAAGYYSQALEMYPNNISALTSLGLALYELHRLEDALRCYIQAAKLTPNDPLPLEKIAHIYRQMGNSKFAQAAATRAAEIFLKNHEVNKALENWQFIAQLNPGYLPAHTRLAYIYERLGRKEDAAGEYLALASLLQKANDVDRAVQAANRAAQINPGSADVLDALAALREFQPVPMPDRYAKSQTSTQPATTPGSAVSAQVESTAEELDPISAARQKSLAVLASVLFDAVEEAQEVGVERSGFRSIMRGTGKLMSANVDRSRIVLHVSQVIELQTQGEVSQAAEELERAVQSGLETAAAYFDLGLLKYLGGDLEEAKRYMKSALQSPEFALGARLVMGQMLQKSGKHKEAALEYLEALRLAEIDVLPKDQAKELDQRYDPLIESQRLEPDPRVHERVCENISGLLIQPGWQKRLSQARKEMAQQGEERRVVPLAELIIQSGSSQIVEAVSRITALERAGLWRSAMEEAYFALDFAPTYLPLHLQMAGLLLSQGQTQEAIEKLLVVAEAHQTRGEAKRAIEIYRQVIELAPLELAPRNLLIQQLIRLGQIEEAVQEYVHLAEVYYNLANLEKARSTYVEAFKLAQQANTDPSLRAGILHHIADIDLQSLDWRQAIQVFEQIRTLLPDDEKARSSLVEINVRLGQEQKAMVEIDNYIAYLLKSGFKGRAVSFLENLRREYPERLAIRHRLASFYKREGRKTEAITELDAIGEMLVEAGKIADAARIIEEILALGPPNVGDYRALLDQLKRGS